MNLEQTHRRAVRLFFAALVGLAFLLLAGGTAVAQLTNEDVAKIPAGPQPIKFSHKIHAGVNKIDCQYCHIYARRSKTSGAPPVAICAGCHKMVGQQLDEVKKVMGYWERQEPIPWVKIHDIPDFVRYTHQKHVNAKNELYPDGIPCQDCHGQIQNMDVVQKANPDFGLMGWCLQCHLKVPGVLAAKRRLPTEAGGTQLPDYTHPNGDYRRPNLTDCLTCHY